MDSVTPAILGEMAEVGQTASVELRAEDGTVIDQASDIHDFTVEAIRRASDETHLLKYFDPVRPCSPGTPKFEYQSLVTVIR